MVKWGWLVALVGAALAAGEVALKGAGSTFAGPLYAALIAEYAKSDRPSVSYESVGSGAGIQAIFEKRVDFGATDGFVSDERLRQAPARLLHVPTAMGAVAVIYNLGLGAPLKLDGPTIADLFMGKITKWNDPEIAALNPDASLPNLPVIVVHRAGGSGTTAIFVDFLAKTSKAWADSISRGPQQLVNWPTGLSASGNEAVAALVQRNPGAIGYAEFATAITYKLEHALVKNAGGSFVEPSPKTVSLAAAQVRLPADTRVSLTNAGGGAYPISGFTWALVYQDQRYDARTLEQGKALADWLWWVTHEGQSFAEPLGYASLPQTAIARAEEIVRSLRFGNTRFRP